MIQIYNGAKMVYRRKAPNVKSKAQTGGAISPLVPDAPTVNKTAEMSKQEVRSRLAADISKFL